MSNIFAKTSCRLYKNANFFAKFFGKLHNVGPCIILTNVQMTLALDYLVHLTRVKHFKHQCGQKQLFLKYTITEMLEHLCMASIVPM
jgi:hypothetical protein